MDNIIQAISILAQQTMFAFYVRQNAKGYSH